MARSNGVNVVGLHEEQILLHELIRNGPSVNRVVLVPVGTLDDNALSIDFDQPVLQLDLSEAHSMGYELVVSQRQDELVQVWSLCRPLVRSRNRHGELHRS
jgi:hypothetical protein